MSFTVAEVHSFLIARWSLPIRRSCVHLSAQVRHAVRPKTKVPIPKGIRPQFLQRWLGQSIASRLAWQEQRPGPARYRFGIRSAPCWSQTETRPYEGRALRRETEEDLLRYLEIGIERLYRITQEDQTEIGETLWTLTLLSACQHLAQVYLELRRRYKAERARELTWDALRLFVTWGREPPDTPLLSAPDAARGGAAGAVPALAAGRSVPT
jgi:hypothetical protein